MEFRNVCIGSFWYAIRAARTPFLSFDKMDSKRGPKSYRSIESVDWEPVHIGPNDMRLLQSLLKAGDSDSKFMRAIDVSAEITAPVYWLQELKTYSVSITINSSSLQHTGAKKDFSKEDFVFDAPNGWNGKDLHVYASVTKDLISAINHFRARYIQTGDYSYFRAMRQLMPMSYEYTISWHSNYAVIRNIWRQRIRRPHRLKEWTADFASFISCLPYADDLIMYEGGSNGQV